MMSPAVIITIILAVTIIIIVPLAGGMSIAKTQMASEQMEQYRKLAEQATVAEQKAADAQQKTAETLEDMSARLTAIEKLLRDVQ